MAKRIIKLTESDLELLVNKIIREDKKIANENHISPKREPISTKFTDPSHDTSATIVTRIKVLKDTLNHFKNEGDYETVNELRGYIKQLEQELHNRLDLNEEKVDIETSRTTTTGERKVEKITDRAVFDQFKKYLENKSVPQQVDLVFTFLNDLPLDQKFYRRFKRKIMST